MDDSGIIERYMLYTRETESPYIYHRWCLLASIGALLGRGCYLQFGHQRIFPNIYCLLIGEPGTRKSTAIKTICRGLVSASGYDTFAFDKTTKEKFLSDLEGSGSDRSDWGNSSVDVATAQNLWGAETISDTEPKEVYICADEFSVFAGIGNTEFYTQLGDFWDWDDEGRPFTSRLKNSQSVSIFQPTVSILGGTTPSKFSKIFPSDIMDDGFLSRMILIRGERSDRKYPEPVEPEQEHKRSLVEAFAGIRRSAFTLGAVRRDERSGRLLRTIYLEWREIDDIRFRSYSTRRYTQLLKLCLIVAAARNSPVITEEIVIEANTYLTAAEAVMPKALGEFGKSKNSDVSNKIVDFLSEARRPYSIKELWKQVDTDLEKIGTLAEILNNLELAGKIQRISGQGFLPLRAVAEEIKYIDKSFLTEEEGRVL